MEKVLAIMYYKRRKVYVVVLLFFFFFNEENIYGPPFFSVFRLTCDCIVKVWTQKSKSHNEGAQFKETWNKPAFLKLQPHGATVRRLVKTQNWHSDYCLPPWVPSCKSFYLHSPFQNDKERRMFVWKTVLVGQGTFGSRRVK